MIWLIIIFILIWIIVWILLRVTNVIRPPQEQTSSEIEQELEMARERTDWSKESDIIGGLRNTCGIYTFPATGPSTPGMYTLNKEILDSLTPIQVGPETQDCVDVDQIAAKEQQRTCLGSDTTNICIGYDGQIYQKGQIEILYVPCDVNRCKGTLGNIAIGFDFTGFPANNTLCMSGQVDIVDAGECTLEDQNQIFRIERGMPKTLTPSDGGPFARFIDRKTGKCVKPESVSEGSELVLSDCSPNNGFVWFLAPSAEVDEGDIAPQQILYTTDIDTFPSPSEMKQYVESNNPLSLHTSSGSIVMDKYSTKQDPSAVSQILNYQLFELISSASASGPGARFPFYNWS